MSLHIETQEAFQNLGLGDLPEEWVSTAWDQNFCESVTLPIQVSKMVLSAMMFIHAILTVKKLKYLPLMKLCSEALALT